MSCEDESLVDYFIVATKACDGAPAKLEFVYPPVDDDHDETEFCENVTMFAFPHGYVHSWDGQSLPPPPAHNLFTLTDARGDHLCGASLSFFEASDRRHVKSLCVLTRRPFYTAMLRYLEQVLLLGLHQARGGALAVEPSLCNLFHEVPVPYRGLAVQLQVGALELVLERPPFLDFPFDMDVELMLYAFMMVEPRVMQQLYHHVLLEHRVLVVGNDSVLVTAVVETLKSLVFPLAWLHVVVPNIPDALDLSTLLDAPVPFLAGAHSAQLLHVAVPSNVVKYDLTESRLLVAAAGNNHPHHPHHQMELESVVLPPLPEVSTRLLHKLSATRLADLHTQKKELQQRLWDRRIQLQKCCLTSSVGGGLNTPTATAATVPVVTPKNFFLVKQSLVHKKMMKLYLEVAAALLQDVAHCVAHQAKQLETSKFVERRPAAARAFFQALADTAHFQAFVGQHHEYVAGQLALEDAMKMQFVHKTLLLSGGEKESSNQADASLAVALALTKTFVAHVPRVRSSEAGESSCDAKPRADATTTLFPTLRLDAFGEPREILFPSMATDAVHSSLGTILAPAPAGSVPASRRASKDTSDWMQSFIRTVPLPSAFLRTADPLTASASSSSSGNNNSSSGTTTTTHGGRSSKLSIFGSAAAAPFKRSRTIDRLRNAAPFCRTMTQKALDSTLQSLASPLPLAPPPTRAPTVVRSIWLITTSACACRERVVALTQRLVEQLELCGGDKTAVRVTDAYCALLDALGACGHAGEAKAVFEECVAGSALVSLAGVASVAHFWRPFSALLRCYVANGLVQRAFDLLAQVELEEEQLLDPPVGALAFAAHVLGAGKEVVVERTYVAFSCGSLGLLLAPRLATGAGCELIAFEQEEDSGDTRGGETTEPSLARASGLRVHDVVETVNGELVVHRAFEEIVALLKEASRPMTVTFVRGLDRLDLLLDAESGSATRRSSSSVSASSVSSTAAVLDGVGGSASRSSSSSSSSKGKPRRDLCDRFGLLPRRGIRVTALVDCESCGSRLSLTQVQSGWAPQDANDSTTRCFACGHRFVPRLCVMLGAMTALYRPTAALPPDARVEQFEYLPLPVVREELKSLAQKVPLKTLAMRELRERHPRIYWNVVVKLLSLAVPLDFLDLPDMATDTQTKPTDATPVPAAAARRRPLHQEDDGDAEMRAIREMVVRRAERIQSESAGQTMEDVLASVIKAVEAQSRQEIQSSFQARSSVPPGRQRWSLFGSLHGSSPRGAGSASVQVPPATLARGRPSHDDGDANELEDRRRSSSDDERETDVEDMRSSRTVSVTDSVVVDDLPTHAEMKTKKKPTVGSKFLPSLPAAPFRRSSRAVPPTAR